MPHISHIEPLAIHTAPSIIGGPSSALVAPPFSPLAYPFLLITLPK